MAVRAGMIHFVGAGPGRPGCVTARAAQILQAADIVFYCSSLGDAFVETLAPQAEHVALERDREQRDVESIASMLTDAAREGARVVRLVASDPLHSGEAASEILALETGRVRYEVVPGLDSLLAGATFAGIPLMQPGVASSLLVLRGPFPHPGGGALEHAATIQHSAPSAPRKGGVHIRRRNSSNPTESDSSSNASFLLNRYLSETTPAPDFDFRPQNIDPLYWKRVGKAADTLVLLEAAGTLQEVRLGLLSVGHHANDPVIAVRNPGRSEQNVLASTIDTMCDDFLPGTLSDGDMLILGDCVNLRDFLDGTAPLPLANIPIGIASVKENAIAGQRALESVGARVRPFPVLELCPACGIADILRQSIDDLRLATHVVFMDGLAAKAFLDALPGAGMDLRAISEFAEIIAMTSEAADVLAAARLRPRVLEGVLGEMELYEYLPEDLAGKRVVLIGEAGCNFSACTTVRRRGGNSTQICVYERLLNKGALLGLREALNRGELRVLIVDSAEVVSAAQEAWGTELLSRLTESLLVVPRTAEADSALHSLHISTPLSLRDSSWQSIADALCAWAQRSLPEQLLSEAW